MAKTIVINNFSGGVDDPRAVTTNTASSSRHFILGKTKLEPYRAVVTETIDTGTFANYNITDVTRFTPTGGSEGIYGLGNVSGQTYPQLFQKVPTNIIGSPFQLVTNGNDTTGSVISGTLIGYKGALYCLKTVSGNTQLVKFIPGTSTTTIGTIGASPTNGVVPKMFIHPKDNRLYAATGYTMMSYDGTTISTRDFSTGHNITSTTHYGNNIALGMVSKDNGASVLIIWDGSVTSSVTVDNILFGDDTLMILENLGDIIVGVSAVSVGGAADTGIQNTITVRGYSGGAAQVLKRIESIGTLGSVVYPFKAKRNDVLYFPMGAYLNGTRVKQIWALYRNESGMWALTPDRKIFNDTEVVNEAITGLSVLGDFMWVSWSGGVMYRTDTVSTNYAATSSYVTQVNQGMEVEDRSKNKQLQAVALRCGSPTGVSHTVTLSYSVDTGNTWNEIDSSTSTDRVRVIEATNQSNGSPLLDGREYLFKIETTGNGEVYDFRYLYNPYPTLI